MFQQPSAGGDQINFSDLVGSLILIYPAEFRQGIQTTRGPADAIAADVHVLQGSKAGESYENTLIWPKILVGSLKSAIGGEPVLARVGVGVAKPGQSAPYILNPYSDTDAAVATAWITARATAVQQPAPVTQAAPAAAPAAPPPAATTIDVTGLPPEVVELLKQAGQVPA